MQLVAGMVRKGWQGVSVCWWGLVLQRLLHTVRVCGECVSACSVKCMCYEDEEGRRREKCGCDQGVSCAR